MIWLIGLELLLPLTVVLLHPLGAKRFSAELVLLCPALLAPLALLFPWAAVVGHLGTELGGPEFFHQWLTKHPDLGPVNCEVLLGILCLLGASLAPTVLAIYRLMGGHRRVVVLLLSAATVLAYLPVLIRLDLLLWVIGLLDAPSQLEAACGPLVRSLAALATVVLAVRATRVSEPQTSRPT
jgi:hypothetical protein